MNFLAILKLRLLRENVQPLTLIGLAVVLLWLHNGDIPFWDQDEAAYAGFALRMETTGEWWIPDFLWSELHRKPPLQFWLMAGAMASFGWGEFGARLPSSVAVLATGIVVWRWGRAIWGEAIAQRAMGLIFTSLLFPLFGKVALTDGLLVSLETVAMLAMIRAILTPHWVWPCWLWGAVALGVLTKGPPILVLVLGSWGLWWLGAGRGDRCALTALRPWFFVPLSLIPFGLWLTLTHSQDGGNFARWLWDWYIAHRVSGGVVFGQWGLPGYYLLLFILAFLPWLPWLWAALIYQVGAWKLPEQLPLTAWIAAGWLIYELLPSKLPSYALGAYPAVAILIAQVSGMPMLMAWVRWARGLSLFLSVGFGVALVAVGWWIPVPFWGLALTAMVWIAGAMVSHRALEQGRFQAAFNWGMVQGIVLLLCFWGMILPLILPQLRGSQQVAAVALEGDAATTILFAEDFNLPSLALYVALGDRPLQTFTGTTPELAQKLTADPAPVVISRRPEQVAQLRQQVAAIQSEPITAWFDTLGQPQTYWVLRKMAAAELPSASDESSPAIEPIPPVLVGRDYGGGGF